MAGKHGFHVINPPNRLARKVPRRGGPDLPTITERAERELRKLQDRYIRDLMTDFETLSQALEQAKQGSEDMPKLINRIYCTSYEIKGHGATFEFPLLTLIGDALCDLIKHDTIGAARHIKLIELHITAMKLVIKDELRGAGGEVGRDLVATLRAAVDQIMSVKPALQ